MGGFGNIFGIGKQKGSDKQEKKKPQLTKEYLPVREEEKYEITCRELEEELEKVNRDAKGFFLIPRVNYRRSISSDRNIRSRQDRFKNQERSMSKDKGNFLKAQPIQEPLGLFQMKKKNAEPKEVRYLKILQNVCAYEMLPEKRIIAKDIKKVLWNILMHQNGMEEELMGKVWMLASGAANLMNVHQNYYFRLRDSVSIYPNPCFNQIELDLRRTFPYDNQDHVE